MTDFSAKNKMYQQRINDFMSAFLQTHYSQPSRLNEAITYSLLSGGKRIRPLLSYATAEALELDLHEVDCIACSVEMIHAYSLIHDDLPSMDDDDTRRGKPTCHIQFDEATAILAGDALQAMAFEVLSFIDIKPKNVIQMMRTLSRSCGALGMAGGQALDLESENTPLKKNSMDRIHQLKTGALISASVEMVGLLAGVKGEAFGCIQAYGQHFGMAFQIIDDVLDIVGDEETLGKPVGSDIDKNKSTYPSIMGLEASKNAAQNHSEQAVAAIQNLSGNTLYLQQLAEYLVNRQS